MDEIIKQLQNKAVQKRISAFNTNIEAAQIEDYVATLKLWNFFKTDKNLEEYLQEVKEKYF